jgi:hypothetical protein
LAFEGRDSKLALECKFDKSLKLSEIYCKDVFVRKTYTSFSPLIESKANCRKNISIMLSNMQRTSGAEWSQRHIEGLFSRNKFEKSKVYVFIPP